MRKTLFAERTMATVADPSFQGVAKERGRAEEATIFALAGWAFQLAARPEPYAEPLVEVRKKLNAIVPRLGRDGSWAVGFLALHYGVWVHPLGNQVLYRLRPADGAVLDSILLTEINPMGPSSSPMMPAIPWFVHGEHLILKEGTTLSAISLAADK
ncbi:MAG: hypothetical protein AB1486_00925 [Planctomycetota bacterium]